MFNKSKKYGIIKGLHFVCFANINADEPFKSESDNIKVVVDGVVYSLVPGEQINAKKTNVIVLAEILVKGKKWKKSAKGNYDKGLPDNLVGGGYKLVSYILDDNSEDKKIDNLLTKLYSNITKSLTLKFESVYKLEEGSLLTDGTNNIPIKEKVFLFSDLKGINDLNTLKNVIEKKCKDCKVTKENEEGALKNLKIEDKALDNFYVSEYTISSGIKYVKEDKLEDVKIASIINEIKTNKKLILTLKKYVNYTIGNVTLSTELAKTRKLNNDKIKSYKTSDLLKKQIKKLKYSDIKDKIDIFNVDIVVPEDDKDLEEGNVDLKITKDDNDKVSDPMKGTIKFQIGKGSELKFEDGKGSDVDVIFGKTIVDTGGVIINTDMTKDAFKEEVKKYLGNTEIDTKYDVVFTKGFDTANKATDDFIVTVTFKDKVTGFTKELDNDEQNITINLVIDDNSTKQYELVNGLAATYNIAFKKDLKYTSFINELEKKSKKGTDTLTAAIKEVSYNNASGNTKWTSAEPKNIGELGIKSVTITLNKQENGVYVKKVASTPPAKDTVTFTLNVTTNVAGKKVKEDKKTLIVTLENSKLTNNELYEKVQTALNNDNNFIINKGNNKVEKNNNKLDNNTNAYSVELTESSSFIEEVKQDDKKDENKDNNSNQSEQKGDGSTETKTGEKPKGCCGGKCSGGDKKNK